MRTARIAAALFAGGALAASLAGCSGTPEASQPGGYSESDKITFESQCNTTQTAGGVDEGLAKSICECTWRGVTQTITLAEIGQAGLTASLSPDLSSKLTTITTRCAASQQAY